MIYFKSQTLQDYATAQSCEDKIERFGQSCEIALLCLRLAFSVFFGMILATLYINVWSICSYTGTVHLVTLLFRY